MHETWTFLDWRSFLNSQLNIQPEVVEQDWGIEHASADRFMDFGMYYADHQDLPEQPRLMLGELVLWSLNALLERGPLSDKAHQLARRCLTALEQDPAQHDNLEFCTSVPEYLPHDTYPIKHWLRERMTKPL